MQLEGTDLPVWGMEIDPDKAKQQFRNYSANDKGNKVNIRQVLPDLTMLQMKFASGSRLCTYRPRFTLACMHEQLNIYLSKSLQLLHSISTVHFA